MFVEDDVFVCCRECQRSWCVMGARNWGAQSCPQKVCSSAVFLYRRHACACSARPLSVRKRPNKVSQKERCSSANMGNAADAVEPPAVPARPASPASPGWRSVKPSLPRAARPSSAAAFLEGTIINGNSPLALTVPWPVNDSEAARVRLPLFCAGMAPISQPTFLPLPKPRDRPKSVGFAREHQTTPSRVGGRTQRLLKAGMITREQLHAEWEQRAKRTLSESRTSHHRPKVDASRRGGSPTRAWQSNMLEEGSAGLRAHRQSAKEREAQREAVAAAALRAKATALAQRVAESAERLARRQALRDEIQRKRHDEWVASRLQTGLTRVLSPRTRREIAQRERSETLAQSMLPLRGVGGDALPADAKVERSQPTKASSPTDGEERVRRQRHSKAFTQEQLALSLELTAMIEVITGEERMRARVRHPAVPRTGRT